MKKRSLQIKICVLSSLLAGALSAATEIKLTGRKDLVLSEDSRVEVLDVARMHLSEKGYEFLSYLEDVKTPYSFEQPVVGIARNERREEVVEEAINYDNASVLRAVAKNFSEQVRGTLARGNTSFLQLQGGSMVKPGTTFPVRIPEAQGQSFTVTITEITGEGYTLKLGDEEQTVRLDKASAGGSGAIRMN